MSVILDKADLAIVDKEFRAESVVWDVLGLGAKAISASDFVGKNEVRINRISGFQEANYIRNANNARNRVTVDKETLKLEHEIWMAYDLDALDQSENAVYDVSLVVEEHIRKLAIPRKDCTGIMRLVQRSTKHVQEVITVDNSLTVFDDAETYMTDAEIAGNLVMFASTEYYRKLKQNKEVKKTFATNTVSINGIDRRVGMLDNEVPIIKVPKDRLQLFGAEGKKINYILVPLEVAAPIEKFGDISLIGSGQDRDGYRDTIKGLNYYDLIVFENARKAIYVSYEATEPVVSASKVSEDKKDKDATMAELQAELTKRGIVYTANNTMAELKELLKQE